MEMPEIHPDMCDGGRPMVLKFTVRDTQYKKRGTPFYVCDCKNAHFRDPDPDWTKPERDGGQHQGGHSRGASGGGQRGRMVSMPSQFSCAHCGGLNDVEIFATAIKQGDSQPETRQREAQDPAGGRGQAATGDRGARGSTERETKPQSQSRGGYERY